MRPAADFSAMQKSMCTSHNAVNQADTRDTCGVDSTGVGAVDCARHNFKRPCSVGDLQKGEKYAKIRFVYSPSLTSRLQYRYVNMDYLILSSLRGNELVTLILSYDIVCQWHKNFRARMETYPHSLQLNRYDELVVVFLVPKFHLPAHIASCQTAFSFNFTKGAARTDGEAPERGWADSNRMAPSTKEMGPGSRRDTLDDHWGDWNYKKVIGLGTYLLLVQLRSTDIKCQALNFFVTLRVLRQKLTSIRWSWKSWRSRWMKHPDNWRHGMKK